MKPSTGAWRARWLAWAAALPACTVAGPSPTDDVDSDRAGAVDLAPRKKLQRGKLIGGERARRTIAWPDAASRDQIADARYATDVHATLARPAIPVLAPAEPGDRVLATSGDTWYALSVHGDGYVLHTTGSSEARVYPHIRAVDPTHPMRTSGGFLTRNEGIWSASWIENGAAYSFEVECDRRVVPWCDDEAEVLQRVEALVHIGSKPSQKEGAR
jgi:hypothetical protein